MKNKYKIGQKVQITRDLENFGENDALLPYAGSVVTIIAIEDGAYTSREIDGMEFTDLDIECIVQDFEDDLDRKNKQIEYLTKALKGCGYTQDNINELLNSENLEYVPILKSLKMNLEQEVDVSKYNPFVDSLDAIFSVGNDMYTIRINKLGSVFIDRLTSDKPISSEKFYVLIKSMSNDALINYLLDKYHTSKYPFYKDKTIDKDLLKKWVIENLNIGDKIFLNINHDIMEISYHNGRIDIYKLDHLKQGRNEHVESIEMKKYNYFWRDPSSDEGEHCSGLCEIIDYNQDSFYMTCYEEIHASDCFDDDNKGLVFGLNIGTTDIDGCMIDSLGAVWFATESERDIYINTLGPNTFSVEEAEYITEAHSKNLRFYEDDAIFYIKKEDGGEAEVSKTELWELIEVDGFNSKVFINTSDVYNSNKSLKYSIAIYGDTMNPNSYETISLTNAEIKNLTSKELGKLVLLKINYENSEFLGGDGISYNIDDIGYCDLQESLVLELSSNKLDFVKIAITSAIEEKLKKITD